MRIILNLLLASIACLSTASVSVQPDSTIYNTRGLTLKKFVVNEYDIQSTLYAAIIDPSFYRASVFGMSEKNINGRTPVDIVRKKEAKVVLGSGFVKSLYPLIPNGFLKVDNAIQNPYAKTGYNGLISIKNNKVYLLPATIENTTSSVNGFQTGPFLVKNSKVIYNTRSTKANHQYNRAFIGVNQNGQILAVVTTEPVSLKALSLFLINTSIKELNCKHAINLSGGGSESLIVMDASGEKPFCYGGGWADNQSAMVAFY